MRCDLRSATVTGEDETVLHRPVQTPELLVSALNQSPGRLLVRQLDGPDLTVGDFRDQTSQWVQCLKSLGIGEGSRVALLSRNRIEVLHVNHAVHLNRAAYAPLHALGSFHDHLHVIMDGRIDLLVFEAPYFEERAVELQTAAPQLSTAALGPSEIAPDLTHLIAQIRPAALVAPLLAGHTLARIAYSGGTTGKAKSIGGRHGTATEALRIVMGEWEWPDPPHTLICSPLSHAGATMFLPSLVKGGTVTILPQFDGQMFLRTIEKYRLNCTLLVPTMIYSLLDNPELDAFDLSSLEAVFYGASSISPARLREAIRRIGPVFSQFYGQAEAPMAVTLLKKADHDPDDPLRLSSCGKALPWNRVALLDADGNIVPDGQPGELCVRGPLVMWGYRNDPDQTAKTFEGGWLHTGDIAVRDSDGFLRIVDRKKDMIISGGFNVYPREIEDILSSHPGVREAAVFGLPHPQWGEAVTAAVVLRDGEFIDQGELRRLVVESKGSYQAPKQIYFVDGIPVTAVGKPDKKALRDRFS